MKTFGSVLEQNNGAGPGFDLLRLALAVAILTSHCSAVADASGLFPSLLKAILHLIGHAHAAPVTQSTLFDGGNHLPLGRPLAVSHVPMFFALSGFLVTGSAFRTKRVFPFLALRFFRIFPALCVEVGLSAVLIGALFTSFDLRSYFGSPEFAAYFGNILGIVQMFLPGVTFAHGGVVNANLWTLPGEFHCYLILAALIITGAAFNRAIYTIALMTTAVGLISANIFFDYKAGLWVLDNEINVFYFFVGALFFVWRDRIPYALWLFIPCVLLTYLMMFSPRTVFIVPFLLTYITAFLGLTNFGQYRIIKSGDYSYGIYLYGFPITQVVYTIFPILHGNMLALAATSLTCTGAFAFLSWHLIEKHFLGLRKRFSIQSARIAEHRHPADSSEGQPYYKPKFGSK